MNDHRVREAERQYESELSEGERVSERMKELLPEILANPADHDIDVDLLDNGDFLEFLEDVFVDSECSAMQFAEAVQTLRTRYVELAEKRAESLAQDEIYNEVSDRGYTE